MFSIAEKEWAFRDADGGISVLDVTNFNTRVVISNHTFVSFSLSFSESIWKDELCVSKVKSD